MRRLFLALGLLAASLTAFAAASLPSYLVLPVRFAPGDISYATYEQHEFTLRDDTAIHRGRYWRATADAAKLGDDPRQQLAQLIEAMKKAGWEVAMQDLPRNPPLATFHYTRDGKDAWAAVQTGEGVMVTLVESAAPSAKLDLPVPTASAKVAASADFPMLKRFPGSKLTGTVDDDRPFLVAVDPAKEPVQVASGAVVKSYEGLPNLGTIEPIVVYSDALKRAGWTLVEEDTAITSGDPSLTAHFVRGTTDLWAHVHSRGGDGYTISLADAGAERGATKMKAELDRACKVPVYGLNFDFDKATLRADSEAALNAILAFLQAYPDLAVELGGHTDNVGKPDYNAKLSTARVETVRGWLVGKGVKPTRLTAKGYGDTQPVASNDSPEGRAKNRRVELRKPGC